MVPMIFIAFFNIGLCILLRFLITIFCIYVLGIQPNADMVLIISGLISGYIGLAIILLWGDSK